VLLIKSNKGKKGKEKIKLDLGGSRKTTLTPVKPVSMASASAPSGIVKSSTSGGTFAARICNWKLLCRLFSLLSEP
jgi:hypothetical protein